MAVRKNTYVDFRAHQPICNTAAVGQIAVVTDTGVNFWHAGGVTFECRMEQQNDDIIPTKLLDANCIDGWQIPNDNADNDGIEISQGILSDTTMPYAFKIGTDPAFQFSLQFGIPDVSDYDVAFVGFRIAAAYGDAINAPAALGTVYTDIGGLTVNAGDIYSVTRLNTGAATLTDTTNNWADDAAKTLTTKVSAAGVVTFEIDGSAPTVNTNTLTFDTGDIVIPCAIFCKGANAADTPPILATWSCGYQ